MSLVSNSISMVSESKSVDDIEKALFLLYSKEEVRRHGEDMVEKYALKGDKDSVLFFYSRMDERYTVRDLSVYINDAALAYAKNTINNVGEENLPSYVVEYLSKIKSEEFALGKIKDCLPRKFISKVEESINAIADEIKKEGDFYVNVNHRKIKFKDCMKEIELFYGNDKKNIRDERKYVLDYHKKYISHIAKLKFIELNGYESGAEYDEVINNANDAARKIENEYEEYGGRILKEIQKEFCIKKEDAESLIANRTSTTDNFNRITKETTFKQDKLDFFMLFGGGTNEKESPKNLIERTTSDFSAETWKRQSAGRAFFYLDGSSDSSGSRDASCIYLPKYDKETHWHELGHYLECSNRRIYQLALAWRERRTKKDKKVKLSSIFPGAGYKIHEVTKPDNFITPYIGKIYEENSTEVVSMGCQYFSEPKTVAMLAARDPDMMSLMITIMGICNGKADKF